MKRADLNLTASITDPDNGDLKCSASLTYYGLDPAQLLFVEHHFIQALAELNASAAEMEARKQSLAEDPTVNGS